ncbi:septation protein IspZ [Sphingomonas sp. PAMC 26621]|uniref:septation protein IspZ n=1 Tax=Sphingomonas sp. PAMC 26621 TaxID=1112213 RepID=UPI000289E8D3|nr:septation protein IspZ [Sphingomonas sp. PAMC 26621]
MTTSAPLPSSLPAKPPLNAGQRLAVDIGPIAIFFLVNFLTPGYDMLKLIAGTSAFMVASIAAMIYSLVKSGRISPMLWLTGTLVLVFGGLTLYFHNKDFIQIKPTVIYAMLSAILVFGLVTGRPFLSLFLDSAYPGLNDTGWRKLTINWAAFFAFLAVLNEVVRHEFSYSFWLGFKLWGVIPLTLIFAFANVPMLMKHGFKMGEEPPIPPVE